MKWNFINLYFAKYNQNIPLEEMLEDKTEVLLKKMATSHYYLCIKKNIYNYSLYELVLQIYIYNIVI